VCVFWLMGAAATGTIDESKLRAVLTTFGTPLSSEEVADLTTKAGVNAAGKIEYKSWVERSYS
jgi:Ca2+-binding EF-hand superfamily protein